MRAQPTTHLPGRPTGASAGPPGRRQGASVVPLGAFPPGRAPRVQAGAAGTEPCASTFAPPVPRHFGRAKRRNLDNPGQGDVHADNATRRMRTGNGVNGLPSHSSRGCHARVQGPRLGQFPDISCTFTVLARSMCAYTQPQLRFLSTSMSTVFGFCVWFSDTQTPNDPHFN